MRARLPKLRCFAFLDEVAEVTDVILAAPSLGDAAAQVIADPRLVWLDGHSDYGHVLTRSARRSRMSMTSQEPCVPPPRRTCWSAISTVPEWPREMRTQPEGIGC